MTIRYRDAAGKVTVRTVTVLRRFGSPYGEGYIRAYCHLRGEERTFRESRILASERFGTTSTRLPAAPASQNAAGQRGSVPAGRGRSSGGGFLVLCLFALVGWWVAENPEGIGALRPAPGPVSVIPLPPPKPTPPVVPLPAPAPTPTPTPPPPVPPPAPAREYTLQVSLRIADFVAETGVQSAPVIEWYAEADTNRNGNLDWDELRAFQGRLVREFPYRNNAVAYSPDVFLSAGSGDCEDFALFTCGLLRFWGIDSYLGSLGHDSVAVGHAVALIPLSTVPEGFVYWDLDAGFTAAAGGPPGIYVPVDYDHVGGLSNAVGPGWTLRWMRRPESVYGMRM